MPKNPIDAAQWVELNRLLDAALDVPSEQRERWLETLDAQHSALKPRLRELLSRAAQVETSGFLNTLPKVAAGCNDGAGNAAERPGCIIGAYRLVRGLGAGGMGSVWLAERTDGLIARAVALKLPHVASHRSGLAERMAREREILASLAHPNIARLYDAGVSTEGRPYLAIEYIEGTRIDTHCQQHALDPKARLRLFLQVANAVAYAHAKLVIHRDLKPANILVTNEGKVQLLDFGVAKLLDDGLAQATQLTEMSGRALTLDYASPEQIRGESLTIATDVYSLGVVLYELLTGVRPYVLKRDSRGALEEAILHTSALPPSAATALPLRKALRGDIDTILLKALKKAPAERYATVPALAEDIERHLQQRAVLAQRDSRWYRLERFIARNRLALGSATAVCAAIIVGATLALWQARTALAQSERAEQVRSFIAAIFQDASPYQTSGQTLSGRELLLLASQRIDAIEQGRPDLRAELFNILASSLLSLEDLVGAASVLDKAEAATAQLTQTNAHALERRRLRAELQLAQGDIEAMRAQIEPVVEILRRHPPSNPADFARMLLTQVKLENASTQYAAAEAIALEGLQVLERAQLLPSADGVALLSALQLSHRQRGNELAAFPIAERAYRGARALQRGDELHPVVLSTRFTYAQTLADNARLIEAAAELDEVLIGTEQAFGATNRQLGVRLASTAEIYAMAGRIDDAQRNADRALEILARYHDPSSRPWAIATEVQGLTRLAARQGSDAAQLIGSAQQGLAAHLGDLHWMTQRVKRNHALAIAIGGDLPAAESQLREVIEKFPVFAAEEFDRNSHHWGVMKRLAGEHDEALNKLQASLDSLPDKPLARFERAHIEIELGLVQLDSGATELADATLRRAFATLNAMHVPMTPARADASIGLGRIALERGRLDEALAHLQAASAYWQLLNPDSRWAGEADVWLGRCYLAQENAADARILLQRARRTLARSPFRIDSALMQLAQ